MPVDIHTFTYIHLFLFSNKKKLQKKSKLVVNIKGLLYDP